MVGVKKVDWRPLATRMLQNGHTVADVCAATGRKKTSIKNLKRDLGLTRLKIPKPDKTGLGHNPPHVLAIQADQWMDVRIAPPTPVVDCSQLSQRTYEVSDPIELVLILALEEVYNTALISKKYLMDDNASLKNKMLASQMASSAKNAFARLAAMHPMQAEKLTFIFDKEGLYRAGKLDEKS